MKVISNGVEKDVDVYKHFKIANDEYVLYKNAEKVSVALINGDKLVAPDPGKLDELMKVLGNLISPTVNESLLFANDCTLMSDVMEATMQEVGCQYVNINSELLNKLNGDISPAKSITPVNTMSTDQDTNTSSKLTTPQNNKMKIYILVIVILVIVLFFVLFKDKLFTKSSGGDTSPTPEPTITSTPAPITEEIAICPNCVYAYYQDYKYFLGNGRSLLTDYASNYQDLKDDSGNTRNIFLGHVLDSEGKLEKSFACGIENGQLFCLEGTSDGSQYETNKTLLQSIYKEKCTETEIEFLCSGNVKADIYRDGKAKVLENNYECQVSNSGGSACLQKD